MLKMKLLLVERVFVNLPAQFLFQERSQVSESLKEGNPSHPVLHLVMLPAQGNNVRRVIGLTYLECFHVRRIYRIEFASPDSAG